MNFINNYYFTSYNCKGKYNLTDSTTMNSKKTFAIQCKSPKVKTYFFSKLQDYLVNAEHSIDIIHNPLENQWIEGIIDNDLGICILCSSLINNYEDNNNIINLDECIHKSNYYKLNREKMQNDISAFLNNACRHFYDAKLIHDEWEEIYIKFIDFEAMNNFSETFLHDMFSKLENTGKSSSIKIKFFGAISADGAKNYVEEIINGLDKRYFIKGRPGTGKSTFLKKIVSHCQDLGMDVDIYPCASDPDSLDMVVIKQLSTCFFDSTAPHEFFPDRENDEVIDMYEMFLPKNFDIDNKETLNEIGIRYKKEVNQGIEELKKAKECIEELDNCYCNSVDLDKLYEQCKDLVDLIIE